MNRQAPTPKKSPKYLRRVTIAGVTHEIRSSDSEKNAVAVLWNGAFYAWSSSEEKAIRNLKASAFTELNEITFAAATLVRI